MIPKNSVYAVPLSEGKAVIGSNRIRDIENLEAVC